MCWCVGYLSKKALLKFIERSETAQRWYTMKTSMLVDWSNFWLLLYDVMMTSNIVILEVALMICYDMWIYSQCWLQEASAYRLEGVQQSPEWNTIRIPKGSCAVRSIQFHTVLYGSIRFHTAVRFHTWRLFANLTILLMHVWYACMIVILVMNVPNTAVFKKDRTCAGSIGTWERLCVK